MMGGGGGKMAWMAGGVVTEDEGDEGLCGAEALIPSLVVGDKASRGSGLQHRWVKNELRHEGFRPCSTKVPWRNKIKISVLKGI
jgi:hypothetical protein